MVFLRQTENHTQNKQILLQDKRSGELLWSQISMILQGLCQFAWHSHKTNASTKAGKEKDWNQLSSVKFYSSQHQQNADGLFSEQRPFCTWKTQVEKRDQKAKGRNLFVQALCFANWAVPLSSAANVPVHSSTTCKPNVSLKQMKTFLHVNKYFALT